MGWYFYHLFGMALVEVQPGEVRAGSRNLHARLFKHKIQVFFYHKKHKNTLQVLGRSTETMHFNNSDILLNSVEASVLKLKQTACVRRPKNNLNLS